MTSRKFVLAAIIVSVCAVAVAVAAPRIPALYEDVVLDNKSHRWRCEDLPSEQELKDLLARNSTTVQVIRSMDPEIHAITLEIGSPCSGGYDLLITYSTHSQRKQIEDLIRGTELERAPINWRNI